jgi:C4-dicarboxylate transporter
MNEFSKNVHWTTATGISVVGILFFFLSKYLKKKEDLFITEKLGAITLSSPLYIDLFSILSIVFIITGIFLNYDRINNYAQFAKYREENTKTLSEWQSILGIDDDKLIGINREIFY